MESKYISLFNNLPTELKPRLSGNRILIELLPKEELKTAGGIVLATVSTHKSDIEWLRPKLGIILLKGEGIVNERGEIEEIPHPIGSVCLVSEHAPKSLSTFPGLEGIVTDEVALISRHDIHISWNTLPIYTQYRKTISSK